MRRRYAEWEFDTNGVTTTVSEWGEGDRHAVLLHGVSGNRLYWVDLAPQLVAEGWHVWAPDLRGAPGCQLASDQQVGREIMTYVNDLASWTESAGLERFTLAGHSFGGRLAAEFAATYPERVEKLILIAAAGPDALNDVAQEHPELVQGGTDFHELAKIEGDVIDCLETLRERRADQPAPRAAWLRWLANLEVDEQGHARHLDITATAESQMNIIRTDDQRERLSSITCPAVVLRSVEESAMLRHVIPHYADLLPNARFVDDIPGGHDTPTAAPDAVLDAFRS